MLSYHYIREAIASGSYKYAFVNGKDNLSDVLSKHWGYSDNPKSRSEEETPKPKNKKELEIVRT